MNAKIRWVKLTKAEISEAMLVRGVSISKNIVRKLLKKHKFVKRKMQRNLSCGNCSDRDEQFNIITAKRDKFSNTDNPVISIDTKKKELLGNLYRAGSVYCTKAQQVLDHDYQHLATGKIAPHGIYDIKTNNAYINVGMSSETADFVCDSLYLWWSKYGKNQYPKASKILILCDAGGANSYRHYVFKLSLQELANKIGLALCISHYPPYSSKWNLIEHRVFPHVTRALAGEPLLSVDDALEKISSTKTSAGLKVASNLIDKIYKTGKRATKAILEKINITFDDDLGKFNYMVAPQVT